MKLHQKTLRTTKSLMVLTVFFLTSTMVVEPANADSVSYDIDVSELDESGSSSGAILRVFGIMTLDIDITDTSNAIQSSSLFYQRNMETPIEMTDFVNFGGPQIDFNQIGDDLFVKGLGQDNEFQRWETSDGSFQFQFGSGPGNDSVALFDNGAGEFWVRDNTAGNGYRLGSVSSIPEPGTTVILAGASLFAMLRRRR